MPPTIKLPRKARAVVFDMDGLIFNTEEIYRDAVMTVAADGGHDVPLAFYLSTIGTQQAAQHSNRCGLTGSIGAQEPEKLAFANSERNAFDRD